jgi:hypothetical protein
MRGRRLALLMMSFAQRERKEKAGVTAGPDQSETGFDKYLID